MTSNERLLNKKGAKIMGFFSWDCAKCGESICNIYADGVPRERKQAVMLTPSGPVTDRGYGGYGIIGGVDVYEWIGEGDRDLGIHRDVHGEPPENRQIKIVHLACWDGETYDQLPASPIADDQGYFTGGIK
jgi:hypothetical protein